jgi:DNA-binding LacI/PurR family transcriptional regulator
MCGLVQYADFRQAGGYEAMNALLVSGLLPTAVFTGSNLITLGALQSIHEHKLCIPGDIAMVGFDDMPWAASLQPPLTVVAQPAFEMGLSAAGLLLDRIANSEAPPRTIVHKTKLILRASSGPVPASQDHTALRS